MCSSFSDNGTTLLSSLRWVGMVVGWGRRGVLWARILLNEVTSPETVLYGYSVKTNLNRTPLPILYFISYLGENIGGEGD